MERKEWVSKSGLKLRGWTDAGVKKYLGEPDKLVPNPHYRSAAKMRLYKLDRVEQKELDEEVQRYLLRKKRIRKKLSKMQTQRMDARKQTLYRKIKNTEFSVLKLDDNKVLERAIEHYNEFNLMRERDFERATQNSEKSFLERIAVNFIRHELTSYDDHLSDLFNKAGRRKAYKLIKNSVLHRISQTYPRLREECFLQMSQKSDLSQAHQ